MGVFMEFFKKLGLCAKNIFCMIFMNQKRRPFPKPTPKPVPDNNKKGFMKYYTNDPEYKSLITEVENPAPIGLKLRVPNLQSGNFDFTSPQGLANNAYALLCFGINMFNAQFNLKRWAMVDTLEVNTMAGIDANAYYDRQGLKFFYFVHNDQTVYTALSSDIVSHELGHALLDAIRPDLFSAAAMEAWAFHESFGDVNAILCALEHDQVVDYALQQTGGDLRKSNIVSRIAEQFGLALGKNIGLREAANNFSYVNPASLPTKSNSPDGLAREPHSFSRVMTGAFYDVFCTIYEKLGKDKAAVVKTKDYLKSTFYKACLAVPSTTNFFEAFCLAWIKEDEKLGSIYKDCLLKVFQSRSLLKVKMMAVEDPDGETKEKLEIHDLGNMKLEKCKLCVSVKDLFEGSLNALSDGTLEDMKVHLAVDNLYLNDDVVTWQNCCDPVSQAKESAKQLVEFIVDNDMFGNKEHHMWYKNEEGYLTRKLFQCDCYRPNYLFPGNPEYNKPYKPKNNSGCCTYGSCANLPKPTPAPSPVKNCNVRYGKSCNSLSYRGTCGNFTYRSR